MTTYHQLSIFRAGQHPIHPPPTGNVSFQSPSHYAYQSYTCMIIPNHFLPRTDHCLSRTEKSRPERTSEIRRHLYGHIQKWTMGRVQPFSPDAVMPVSAFSAALTGSFCQRTGVTVSRLVIT